MSKLATRDDQWTLTMCVEEVMGVLSDEDRDFLRDASEDRRNSYGMHHTMGRWIRNECKLWEFGTGRCVDEIVERYLAGELQSAHLDRNDFIHPDIPFKIENIRAWPAISSTVIGDDGKSMREERIRPDRNLSHPDNCSAVVIEAVVQRIRDVHG